MKRTISILLAAVMLFAVGCGKQGEKNIDTDSLDIDEFYESIGSMTNEELVTLDDTYISNYYGMSQIGDLVYAVISPNAEEICSALEGEL